MDVAEQQGGAGVLQRTTGVKPARPTAWLSKAELTQEIQRLGNLCEARTKELNRLKMETKHVTVGFDAFASLFKYMVEDLNALSMPVLSEDLKKTLKQLELAKQDLAYYEREVEEMKAHHCQELNDLSNKLFEVFHGEVTELSAKHQEEMNRLQSDHQKEIESLSATFDATSADTLAKQEAVVAQLQQELISQREELQLLQEREIADLEQKHAQSTRTLQEHAEQLQKKCAELRQHSLGMEDAMRKDTDTKLQWVTSRKVDLEKEVESLKAVLEMKNKELHTLRVQNLEMEKQMEDLPLAREKIKMLQARAEDLEALMEEKTKLERRLSTENQQIRDTYERESKVNKRLSMENEELQWRIRQAEQSFLSGSFTDVAEYPEDVENGSLSPAKSPAPQTMSRSVFFTYMDREDQASSPRAQYKKITPGFAASYKTSPCKSSAPSPRRASEPPQPQATPRKVSKGGSLKQKGAHKRQRSGSDCGGKHASGEPPDVAFLSVAGSMTSSVSSESSVFGERLLEEHKEQILESLEILREQRSSEVDWCDKGEEVTTPNLESEDMSRSSEFSDPKTYYHMTFNVMKEQDGDLSAPAQATHSTSESSSSPVCDPQMALADPEGACFVKMAHSVDHAVESSEHDKQSKEQDRWRTI
ncbi:microtubule-associated tumor suppressor candidate 2-like protein [Caerostris extrusa]|uniref:Microtubule-associated tumor suppressor candidate 2-like protein n=1 Tax=Caerostris extrusa TaxID=172846 RepID=A0AAV4PU64_CAEEX|nr:microtubule-associated tumor suppressor candidate 2-like protein [Caerostris extrusa]